MSEILKKKCARCGQVKPSTDFWKNLRMKDGLDSWCKQCHKERGTAYRREKRANDPAWRERDNETAKRYRQTENAKQNRQAWARSEKAQEYQRSYPKSEHGRAIRRRYQQSEKFKDYQRQYEQKPEVKAKRHLYKQSEHGKVVRSRYDKEYMQRPEVRSHRRQWEREHAKQDHVREYQRHKTRIRRARRMGSDSSYTMAEWEALLVFYNNTCLCCGLKGEDTALGKLTPDHIVPLSKGGSNTIDNIQPLCLPCNLTKGQNIINYRY